MRRILALILSFALLLTGCAPQMKKGDTPPPTTPQPANSTNQPVPDAFEPSMDTLFHTEQESAQAFQNLDDPNLLQYVKDTVYADLASEFSNEDYIIENVNAIYYSKEYLQNVAYNSKSNIFFGYTLAELDGQFQGERYVFTLSDDGETVVQAFEDYDGTYERVIENVAIGTGVILVCMTVSVVSRSAGISTISVIFAASAKTGTKFALSSACFSGIFAGILTGIQTKDFAQAANAAALASSESFKWGAISGTLIGGLTKAHSLRSTMNISEGVPSWAQSEADALKKYGGKSQITYINGQEVPYGTPDAVRPDIVRTIGDHLEAIEVKNYDLTNSSNLSNLYSVLKREISDRFLHCPPGTTQRIVLDVRGRNYSQELISSTIEAIKACLADISADIPIDILI